MVVCIGLWSFRFVAVLLCGGPVWLFCVVCCGRGVLCGCSVSSGCGALYGCVLCSFGVL